MVCSPAKDASELLLAPYVVDNFQPSILPKCKSFVKTLLVLIDQAGCLGDRGKSSYVRIECSVVSELIYELGEKTPVEETPITVLNAIVRNGEGSSQ